MSNFILGDLNTKFKVGGDDCSIYLGTTLLYSGGTPPTPPAPHDYLTFIATESGTFKFSGNSINYSLDSGTTWTSLASNTSSPTVSAGSKIMWKASGLTPTSSGIGRFSSTSSFEVEGNVMSLYYGDDFEGEVSLSGKSNAFKNLFINCTGITSAENLVLPATTLSDACYDKLFQGCRNLTTAPNLPATTLASYCYENMFYDCRKLTTAPALPATTLEDYCYYAMFTDCKNLVTAPQLPATTLATNCYQNMFAGCSSLTTAPALPATTLASHCYENMFQSCTSLTTAPALPATTLSESCYSSMFSICTGLTTAPSVLPAITLADYCYYAMFYGCSSLTTTPVLPATTLVDFCYQSMFRNCSNLNNVTCLATDISAVQCTNSWLSSVAASGTFTKAASMTGWTTGVNGIPSGWTVA